MPNKSTNFSHSYNEQAGVISINATLCDKKFLIPTYFDDINYSVSIVPAMPTFVPFQGLDMGGQYTVQKLGGFRRRTLSIQGDGQINNCGTYEQAKASLTSYINNLKNTYLSGSDVYLSQIEINRGSGSLRNKLTFSFTWNEQDTPIFSNSHMHSSL
jgi:hypothetical protein